MKIANIIEDGRYGGPQVRILGVAEKLKGYGIDTVVVFPEQESEVLQKNVKQKPIKAVALNLHSLRRKKTYILKYIVFFIPEVFSIYKLLKKENIDIVHANSSRHFKGLLAGKFAGSKVIWHLHDTSSPRIFLLILNILGRYLTDGLIAAGNRVKSYYLNHERFCHKPTCVIEAPVNTSLFNPVTSNKNATLEAFDGIRIVTIGNLNPAKGLEYFIEMAAFLNKTHKNLFFFIVGPHIESQKEYSDNLFRLKKELSVDNLHFFGATNDVPGILNSSDIYVCSSIAEASPISVWEAMAMEKAIVATDVGDISGFIEDGKNGFIVPSRNSDIMAEKTAILIKDNKLRKEFGNKARKTAVKYLDIEICALKHAKFYRKIFSL